MNTKSSFSKSCTSLHRVSTFSSFSLFFFLLFLLPFSSPSFTFASEESSWIRLPPSTWQCPSIFFDSQDGCDCSCGLPDPDCQTTIPPSLPPKVWGCPILKDDQPGTTTQCSDKGSCIYSSYPRLRADPPSAWTCDPVLYDAGNGCDCNCGAVDPDCPTTFPSSSTLQIPSKMSIVSNCDWSETCKMDFDVGYGVCASTTSSSASAAFAPPEWNCPATHYGSSDGCDCGCGAWDPDCSSSSGIVFGCDAGKTCNSTALSPVCSAAWFSSSSNFDASLPSLIQQCNTFETPFCSSTPKTCTNCDQILNGMSSKLNYPINSSISKPKLQENIVFGMSFSTTPSCLSTSEFPSDSSCTPYPVTSAYSICTSDGLPPPLLGGPGDDDEDDSGSGSGSSLLNPCLKSAIPMTSTCNLRDSSSVSSALCLLSLVQPMIGTGFNISVSYETLVNNLPTTPTESFNNNYYFFLDFFLRFTTNLGLVSYSPASKTLELHSGSLSLTRQSPNAGTQLSLEFSSEKNSKIQLSDVTLELSATNLEFSGADLTIEGTGTQGASSLFTQQSNLIFDSSEVTMENTRLRVGKTASNRLEDTFSSGGLYFLSSSANLESVEFILEGGALVMDSSAPSLFSTSTLKVTDSSIVLGGKDSELSLAGSMTSLNSYLQFYRGRATFGNPSALGTYSTFDFNSTWFVLQSYESDELSNLNCTIVNSNMTFSSGSFLNVYEGSLSVTSSFLKLFSDTEVEIASEFKLSSSSLFGARSSFRIWSNPVHSTIVPPHPILFLDQGSSAMLSESSLDVRDGQIFIEGSSKVTLENSKTSILPLGIVLVQSGSTLESSKGSWMIKGSIEVLSSSEFFLSSGKAIMQSSSSITVRSLSHLLLKRNQQLIVNDGTISILGKSNFSVSSSLLSLWGSTASLALNGESSTTLSEGALVHVTLTSPTPRSGGIALHTNASLKLSSGSSLCFVNSGVTKLDIPWSPASSGGKKTSRLFTSSISAPSSLELCPVIVSSSDSTFSVPKELSCKGLLQGGSGAKTQITLEDLIARFSVIDRVRITEGAVQQVLNLVPSAMYASKNTMVELQDSNAIVVGMKAVFYGSSTFRMRDSKLLTTKGGRLTLGQTASSQVTDSEVLFLGQGSQLLLLDDSSRIALDSSSLTVAMGGSILMLDNETTISNSTAPGIGLSQKSSLQLIGQSSFVINKNRSVLFDNSEVIIGSGSIVRLRNHSRFILKNEANLCLSSAIYNVSSYSSKPSGLPSPPVTLSYATTFTLRESSRLSLSTGSQVVMKSGENTVVTLVEDSELWLSSSSVFELSSASAALLCNHRSTTSLTDESWIINSGGRMVLLENHQTTLHSNSMLRVDSLGQLWVLNSTGISVTNSIFRVSSSSASVDPPRLSSSYSSSTYRKLSVAIFDQKSKLTLLDSSQGEIDGAASLVRFFNSSVFEMSGKSPQLSLQNSGAALEAFDSARFVWSSAKAYIEDSGTLRFFDNTKLFSNDETELSLDGGHIFFTDLTSALFSGKSKFKLFGSSVVKAHASSNVTILDGSYLLIDDDSLVKFAYSSILLVANHSSVVVGAGGTGTGGALEIVDEVEFTIRNSSKLEITGVQSSVLLNTTNVIYVQDDSLVRVSAGNLRLAGDSSLVLESGSDIIVESAGTVTVDALTIIDSIPRASEKRLNDKDQEVGTDLMGIINQGQWIFNSKTSVDYSSEEFGRKTSIYVPFENQGGRVDFSGSGIVYLANFRQTEKSASAVFQDETQVRMQFDSVPFKIHGGYLSGRGSISSNGVQLKNGGRISYEGTSSGTFLEVENGDIDVKEEGEIRFEIRDRHNAGKDYTLIRVQEGELNLNYTRNVARICLPQKLSFKAGTTIHLITGRVRNRPTVLPTPTPPERSMTKKEKKKASQELSLPDYNYSATPTDTHFLTINGEFSKVIFECSGAKKLKSKDCLPLVNYDLGSFSITFWPCGAARPTQTANPFKIIGLLGASARDGNRVLWILTIVCLALAFTGTIAISMIIRFVPIAHEAFFGYRRASLEETLARVQRVMNNANANNAHMHRTQTAQALPINATT